MKNLLFFKNVLLCFIVLQLFASTGFAQVSNLQGGCATQAPNNAYIKANKINKNEVQPQQLSAINCNPSGEIPVVFHVISDLGGCFALGNGFDYTRANALAALDDLNTAFPISGIEFRLADLDNNDCRFDGITYRNSSQTNSGANLDRGIDLANFPANRYLNVWMVNRVNGTNSSGVAFFPEQGPGVVNGSNADGITMAAFAMPGSSNYDNAFASTLPHEIGHWLGLRHTWSNLNNGPGNSNNCNADDSDFIPVFLSLGLGFTFCPGATLADEDTPNCIGHQGACNAGGYTLCNGVQPLEDNMMDYFECASEFTGWQQAIMRSVLCNPNANGGRGDLLTSMPRPFCPGSAGCNDPFIQVLESTFFEGQANDGSIENTITLLVPAGSLPTGNITSQVDIDDPTVLNNILVNSIAPNIVEISFPNNFVSHEGTLNFSIDFSSLFGSNSTLCNQVIDFTIDFEQNCSIAYNDQTIFDEVQSDGIARTPIIIPHFSGAISASINVNNNTFSINPINVGFESIAFASTGGTVQVFSSGDEIGPNLTYSATANFPTGLNADQPFYVGVRVISGCGTSSYYGWIRFFIPSECTGSIRGTDAAMQQVYGASILAGETVCYCTCSGSITASAHTFQQSPTDPTDIEPIIYTLESTCSNASLSVSDVTITTNIATSDYTVTASGNQLTIDITNTNLDPSAFDFTVTFNSNLIPNGCLGGDLVFEPGLFLFQNETDCYEINQTVCSGTNNTLLTVLQGRGQEGIYLYVSIQGNQITVDDNSYLTVSMAGNQILGHNRTFDFSNPVSIENPVTLTMRNGRNYLPIIFQNGCEDNRLGYFRFTKDCFGCVFFYDFVYNLSPEMTSLTTGVGTCLANHEINYAFPELTNSDFGHILDNQIGVDFSSFTTYGDRYEFRYRELGSNDWITVNNAFVPISDLLPCTVHEYEMRYRCLPYGWSPWSGEYGVTNSFETDCLPDCEVPIVPTFHRNCVRLFAQSNVFPGIPHQYRYRINGSGNAWSFSSISTATRTLLPRLVECVEIEVQVRQQCGDHWSDWSASGYSFFAADKPDQSTVYCEADVSSVTLYSSAPGDPVLFKYRINNGPWTFTPIQSNNSYTVSGLSPGDQVCFISRRYCANQQGASCWSELECCTVPESCSTSCSDIDLAWADIIGECEIINNEIGYWFEGELNLPPEATIVSIEAEGTNGNCPTDVVGFNYDANGFISGALLSLDQNCSGGDIVLTVETETDCCEIVIPFTSFPDCDQEDCLEGGPSISSSCDGSIVMSVPPTTRTVTVTNNRTGVSTIHLIGVLQGPVGANNVGFIMNFDGDCDELEDPNDSKYDFSIDFDGCTYRFIGDFCEECPEDGEPTDGVTRDWSSGAQKITEVNVYPNPSIAGNDFNIESTSSIKNLTLKDMQGRTILSQQLKEASSSFIMSTPEDLQTGVYILQLLTMDDEFITKKIILID